MPQVLAEFALAVGGTGTGEFGIMELLPGVAGDIGGSIPVAGPHRQGHRPRRHFRVKRTPR
jgi:predicted MFS family arabinose efflux permease